MKRTEISALGKVAFVERLTQPFTTNSNTQIRQGIGDDGAVIDRGGWLEVVTQATTSPILRWNTSATSS